VVAFADPRTILMGVRILCAEGSLELDNSITYIEGPDEYNIFR